MSKQLTGTVVSTKMDKTIVVRVERKFRHPLYRKVIVKTKKFKAHYEGSGLKEGDSVIIAETSPISKEKHFIVVENNGKAATEVGTLKMVAPTAQEEKVEAETANAEIKVAAKAKDTPKKDSKGKVIKKVTKSKSKK